MIASLIATGLLAILIVTFWRHGTKPMRPVILALILLISMGGVVPAS